MINPNIYAYAITINNLEVVGTLKTIDSVHELLHRFGTISIIAVERNELNHNIHYHVLLFSDIEYDTIFTVFKSYGMWLKLIDNDFEILKYYDYCKKDGNYKLYHSLDKSLSNSKNVELLELIERYESLYALFKDNPHLINKVHIIKALWGIAHYK
ncbi:MAG: hypothetical protein QXI16_04170 [Sulfolobaceae archaeon]